MEEKTNNEQQFAFKKERFEFRLMSGNDIVCQRYFRINGFKREALSSIELVSAIDKCVEIIDRDMKDKTHMFLSYTAPQIFDDYDEMYDWLSRHDTTKDEPLYTLLRDTNETYVVNNSKIEPYDKVFNKYDYLIDKNTDNPPTFKFAFYDNGREVCSKVWDGSVYPRFIRMNVDLTNSRNRYKNDTTIYAPLESYMIDCFNEEKEDIIPLLMKTICKACTCDGDDYTTVVEYSDKKYDLDLYRSNWKYMRKLEKTYKKNKTV